MSREQVFILRQVKLDAYQIKQIAECTSLETERKGLRIVGKVQEDKNPFEWYPVWAVAAATVHPLGEWEDAPPSESTHHDPPIENCHLLNRHSISHVGWQCLPFSHVTVSSWHPAHNTLKCLPSSSSPHSTHPLRLLQSLF